MYPKTLAGKEKPMQTLSEAISALTKSSTKKGRNLQMSGDPHYQPRDLRPFLGYDQRAGWLVIVEWFWMLALAKCNIMPKRERQLLTLGLLEKLLANITTTQITRLERTKLGHDILALLWHMRKILPEPLHKWLHWGLTSYDVICTAYALQARETFRRRTLPRMQDVDREWRILIAAHKNTRQMGRTHLQDALPITVGCWLAVLHSRFVEAAREASVKSNHILGKFSGAVGTSAALRAFTNKDVEAEALVLLGLPKARPGTQVVQPEGLERFYNEIVLVSAALANLGDDVRHLQASAIGEVISASSTSSTMSHKRANPVGAEQADGMHVSVRSEFDKVVQTLNSTLQRDLRWSNVMRGFNAILVFTYQQLNSAERVLKSFSVDKNRCHENFQVSAKLVVAEALHLALQREGYLKAHTLVNKKIVPGAVLSGNNLAVEMDAYAKRSRNKALRTAWQNVPPKIRYILEHPQDYLGDAIRIAEHEVFNML